MLGKYDKYPADGLKPFPIKWEVAIFLGAMKTGVKRRSDGPLGLKVDFTF